MIVGTTSIRAFVLRLRRSSPLAFLCLIIIVGAVTAAATAPLITPQDPYDNAKVDFYDANLPPGTYARNGDFVSLLGTDALGRDMYSAILYGLRTSIALGLLATFFALSIGGLAGLLAAYFGGITESTIMRTVDIMLGLPTILVAMVIMAIFGPGFFKLAFALALAQWPYYTRTTRAVALVEMGKEYIDAARCLELPARQIFLKHLLPNSMAPLVIVLTLQIAHAIAIEAALSFLGLGVSIEAPSLGLIIANGSKEILSGHSWQLIYPGIALALLIFSINVFGDRLRRLLDPKGEV